MIGLFFQCGNFHVSLINRMSPFITQVRRLSDIGTIASAVAIMAGCMAEPDVAGKPVSGGSGASSVVRELVAEVTVEVNRYRQEKGAKPLPRDRGLDQLAQSHANYLLQNRGRFSLHGSIVSHMGFDGRALIARERLGFDNISENVAATSGGPRGAAQTFRRLWTNSRGHEYTMRSAWTHTGVGVAVADDGLVVAVQLFGVKGIRSHNDMVDKFRSF